MLPLYISVFICVASANLGASNETRYGLTAINNTFCQGINDTCHISNVHQDFLNGDVIIDTNGYSLIIENSYLGLADQQQENSQSALRIYAVQNATSEVVPSV